jgi:hypothetical protein
MGGSASAIAVAEEAQAGSAVVAAVKPVSALLQGEFVLKSFTEYVKAPALPELSREGLWSSHVGDGDDDDEGESCPLDRASLLSQMQGGATTDLDELE